MTKSFPTDTLGQADTVLKAYRRNRSSLKLGTQDQEMFATSIPHIESTNEQIETLEMQLKDLRNHRDDDMFSLWGMIKCARSTIKGIFGDDSTQYKLVGGTRLSERKSNTRKAAEPGAIGSPR